MGHKSNDLLQTCLSNEWKAQIKPEIPSSGNSDEIVWNLYAIRNKETLHVAWLGNRMQGATYTYGDAYCLRLNWRNQVLKLITGKPDPRKLKGNDVDKLIEERYVPWDHDTPDDKILASVIGCKISWIRTIDREICDARIPAYHGDQRDKHLRVMESPPNSGRKVLEWVDATGFHAVRIDSIIDVA